MKLIENLEELKPGYLIKLGDNICQVISNDNNLIVGFKRPQKFNITKIYIEKKYLRRKRKISAVNKFYKIFLLNDNERNKIVCEEIFNGLKE